MKFNNLPQGSRFEFEGKVYVKAGPLTAAAEDGSGLRMIPRHVLLKPVDIPMQTDESEELTPRQAARLRAAAALLVTRCRHLIETACARTDPDLAAALLSELEAARKRFEAALGKDRAHP